MIFTSTQHNWTASDGAVFPYSEWTSTTPPRAILVAVHGLSGAALDYEPLGRHFADLGITTLALELRGQGNDPVPRRRGDLRQFEDWFVDLRAFIALVRSQNPGLPIFYYGESMGAAILTRFLAQADPHDQPAALILASPVVALPRRATWWQGFLFRFFLFFLPTLRINVRKLTKPKPNQPPAYVTRDEIHRKWFETVPHRVDHFTIRFFRCLHELIDGCFAAAPLIRVPVLVLYAKHDIFIAPARVEEFFSRLGSADKELGFFPEAYHLLLHDHDRAQVLARIEHWLSGHLAASQWP
jgi:alpha-beta hydrolase superfamily lysophospholipase